MPQASIKTAMSKMPTGQIANANMRRAAVMPSQAQSYLPDSMQVMQERQNQAMQQMQNQAMGQMQNFGAAQPDMVNNFNTDYFNRHDLQVMPDFINGVSPAVGGMNKSNDMPGRAPGRPMRGPDQMGMPQAYPDRIADPMRDRGRNRDREQGQLTRVSPGVYRNEQGDLVNSRGGGLPNQPRRDRQRDVRREVESGFAGMQPPNGKGPQGTRGVDNPSNPAYQMPYDLNQAVNPIYRSSQQPNQGGGYPSYGNMQTLIGEVDRSMNQFGMGAQNAPYQMQQPQMQQQQQPYFARNMFDRFTRK